MGETRVITEQERDDAIAFLNAEGYAMVRVNDDGRWRGIIPLFSTVAIVTGHIDDRSGYSDRWCYGGPMAARAALAVWDGVGEPVGWHRHPSSGRRIARSPSEYDEHGREVAVGEEYVRR